MDERTMKGWVSDVRGELVKIDKHRDVLLTMLRAFEEWLAINLAGEPPLKSPGAPEFSLSPSVGLDRKMHLNRSVLVAIVHEAAGAMLHVQEIGQRAKAQGYWSRAKNLPATVDSMLKAAIEQGEPIQILGNRLFRSAKFGEPSAATAHEYVPVAIAT